MTYHACVWIDHREANIFEITASDATTSHVTDERPQYHIHGRADHIDKGQVAMDRAMLDAVADKLKAAKGILIVGPGNAKTALKAFLEEHYAAIAANIWDVQSSDHPSDAQLIASARTWFHAQDRMK